MTKAAKGGVFRPPRKGAKCYQLQQSASPATSFEEARRAVAPRRIVRQPLAVLVWRRLRRVKRVDGSNICGALIQFEQWLGLPRR